MVEPLAREPTAERQASPLLAARNLGVSCGRRPLLSGIDLELAPRQTLAVLGPSGAGKTTLLRCFNRLVELTPGLAVRGEVVLHGESIYRRGVDADALRERIGMIFQQPVVFPGSIFANVVFAVRRTGRVARRRWPELVERVLRQTALWPEVEHRLDEPAASLSVGQQQRLCLARVLAGDPEVLLLDEPTSALDPRSTEAIEELLAQLKERCSLIVVTHNPAQARRLADSAAFLAQRGEGGEIVESGPCKALLSHPRTLDLARFLSRESA
jgi:phosphate transport system ATP-binding protein